MPRCPPEADWERRGARPLLDLAALRGWLGADERIEPVGVGLSSGIWRAGDRCVRVHRHGTDGVRRELAIFARLGGTVPIAPVLHADVARAVTIHPWMPGERLVDVLHERPSARGLGHAVGDVLRAIHRHPLPAPGLLGPDLGLATAFGTIRAAWEPYLRDRGLGELADRFGSWLDREPTTLLHGDFKPTNLLVDPVGEAVTAVLDWEFAWAGPPLADVGQLLRWEDRVAPDFAEGFADAYFAGAPPERWRERALLLDLLNLATFVEEGGERARADARERIERTRRLLSPGW